MYAALKDTIASILPEVDAIAPERKQRLDKIATYVGEQVGKGKSADLVFICTHNSRRSHFAQVWAAAAAAYFGVRGMRSWSGGVEMTAISFHVTDALLAQGFMIDGSGGENPEVAVHMDDDADPVICFSKSYDDPSNPQQHFAAVMVCSDAEKACPYIAGADARFSLPYEDPKTSDGTGSEAEVYGRRGREIAREMLYLFSPR